jgi:SAM-dependent methyltransferase
MDNETARALCAINDDFYRTHGASFSATRKAPWLGWKPCLELMARDCPDFLEGTGAYGQRALSVLDLACGNLRFASFLESALSGARPAGQSADRCHLDFYAVDRHDGLVPPMPGVSYQSLDVLGALREGLCLNSLLEAPTCDLAVSFGFLHHAPLREWREGIVTSLVRQTRSGGYVIVSLWQFLNNEALAEKAAATHERALRELALPRLDEGDRLLGWQDIPRAYRYCHSFSEPEIDQLAKSVADSASVLARFTSDGRTNNLNTYLLLKVR